jgi:hypothetical protein
MFSAFLHGRPPLVVAFPLHSAQYLCVAEVEPLGVACVITCRRSDRPLTHVNNRVMFSTQYSLTAAR